MDKEINKTLVRLQAKVKLRNQMNQLKNINQYTNCGTTHSCVNTAHLLNQIGNGVLLFHIVHNGLNFKFS